MVAARAELLSRGHFEPVARAVAGAVERPSVLAELGSGTGYYLHAAHAASGASCAFGFDLSKDACARAARAHPHLRFAVADVEERIPLHDAGADALLSVFAPRPAAEVARVVRPGGVLVAAFATERHLAALRERLGLIDVHPRKLDRLAERLGPWFSADGAEPVEYELELPAHDAALLVAMGPNARHRAGAQVPSEPVGDTVAVLVARFRRRP